MGICLYSAMRKKCAGRPQHCRWVENEPEITCFNPSGITSRKLEQIILTIDELEAIRLADMEGLYQEQAAERIKVSRQTFGRIIASAHKKVAEALVLGKSILIEGGEFMTVKESQVKGSGRFCICPKCEKKIPHKHGIPGLEEKCPKCNKK